MKGVYPMKKFLQKYSYQCVTLFVNQIAIALFAISLAFAAGMAKNEALKVVTSILSVIFMLFVDFTGVWKLGAQDRISIDLGKEKRDFGVPIKMWLISNSLNLLLALFYTLGVLIEPLQGLKVCSVIALLVQGEYMGILSLEIAGVTLNTMWFMYFLITVPTLITIFLAYWLGLKNIGIGKLFAPPKSKK